MLLQKLSRFLKKHRIQTDWQVLTLDKISKKEWRWGINRWIILGLIILSIIGANIFSPVRPHIQVAPERLSETPLFSLPVIGDFYLTNSLLGTLLVDAIILLIALMIKRSTRKEDLVPHGIAGAFESLLEVIYNLTESSAGKWAKKIFPWFATFLILVVIANMVKLIPGFETIGLLEPSQSGHEVQLISGNWFTILAGEETAGGYVLIPFLRGPSTDLNFTIALALISVLMTQVVGFRAQGIRYITKFLNFLTIFQKPFFGFMDFIVGLLELISEFAKVLSFSFRLFGVMFSGVVLVALVGSLLPVFVPSLILAFEVFMGLIQAFVFGMLTMVFMAQATSGHGGDGH